ncbi:GAF domain-containing protein, partial [Verrucomicrobiota bacterium]
MSPENHDSEKAPEGVAEEYVSRPLEELERLCGVGELLSSSLSVDVVVDASLRQARSASGADHAVLLIRDGEDLSFRGEYPESEPAGRMGHEVKSLGCCVCGLAAEGSPVYSVDINEDPRCVLSSCKADGFCSVAALPLRFPGGVAGVLSLASRQKREFSTQAAFLETLASHAGIALQNALLFEKLQEETRRIEAEVEQRNALTSELRTTSAVLEGIFEAIPDVLGIQETDQTIVR